MKFFNIGELGQVFYYDGQLMSWELAASIGDGAVDDIAWTTSANGHLEFVAVAQGSTVSVWQLEGHANDLQVPHSWFA